MGRALDQLTVEDTAKEWSNLEGVVGANLGLARDPLDVDARMLVAEAEPLRQNGIIQGLLDLGYLEDPEGVEDPPPIQTGVIEAALHRWRSDTAELPANFRMSSDPHVPLTPSNALDLADPLPILTLQTSFDGNLEFFSCPAAGEPPTLHSRILQFRLKTFNRYEEPIGLRLTKETYATFTRLRDSFSINTKEGDVALLNRLGNAQELSEVFSRRKRETVFVIKDDREGKSDRKAENYKVKRKSRRTTKARAAGPRHLRRSRVASKYSTVLAYSRLRPRKSTLEQDFASDVNTLGLELLQLRLWQHGFYQGAIDADWGKKSQEALDQFLATFHEEFELKKRKQDFIVEVMGGSVINLAFIFEDLLEIAENTVKQISQSDLAKISDEIFPDPDNQEEQETWETLKKRAKEITDEDEGITAIHQVRTFRHGTHRKRRRRRRLNFSLSGIKGAITGWFRRIGTAAKNIKQIALQIRDAILKGLASIRTFLRYSLDKVKRVIRVAKAAVRRFYYWIAGKPFGTGDPETLSYVATRWSIDFDTVNVFSEGVPPALVQHHLDRLAFMNASLHFMVSMALEVLGVLVKVTTGNWLGIAYAIYCGIRDWDVDIWKENNPFHSYVQSAYVI